ncbi:hypothetical protein [Futiania mangrovi]|uniref:Uncharacterized protein n=1 Tax=Futiania mangrovi TaxID=2959716 RepID=A0A9J6PMI2_9PROT|nr:hypothetical protein [Futiania mangrovii]MCP1337887.1 hypothetical protein [Futiania mangrovii]
MTVRTRLTAAIAGLALSAGAVSPALAQSDYIDDVPIQRSTNTVVRNIPLDSFKEADIGYLVDLMLQQCESPVTQMVNASYRRISNAPGPVLATPSSANANHDYVVWDSGSGFNPNKSIRVRASEIAEQIGVNPGVNLDADPDTQTKSDATGTYDTLTIRDITSFSPALAAAVQLVDAGNNAAGFDAIMGIKNGTPKTAFVVCDMNMYYVENGQLYYGVKNFKLLEPVNRLLVFWSMGSSAAGTVPAMDAFCAAMNPPAVASDPRTNPLAAVPDPESSDPRDFSSSYANTHLLREGLTTSVTGNTIIVYGDNTGRRSTNSAAANHTACEGSKASAKTAFCDPTEPIPDTDAGEVSGNACIKKNGRPTVPDVKLHTANGSNTSCLSSLSGGWIVTDPCNPWGRF